MPSYRQQCREVWLLIVARGFELTTHGDLGRRWKVTGLSPVSIAFSSCTTLTNTWPSYVCALCPSVPRFRLLAGLAAGASRFRCTGYSSGIMHAVLWSSGDSGPGRRRRMCL